MDSGHLIYLSIYAVTSLFLGWLVHWSVRHPDANGSREFLAIIVATTAWSVTITIQLAFADHLSVQILTLYVSNLANHFLWMATIVFAFAFTNHRAQLRHPVVVGMLCFGVFTELAILTNPLHHLVWTDYVLQETPFTHLAYQRGSVFLVAYVVGYAGTALAVGHLVRHALRSNRFVRRQIAFFVLGVGTAAIGNLAYHLDFSVVDTTPLGLLGFAIAATVAIYHFRFFEITPVAYSHVFDEVSNAIVVVDTNDHVALVNDAATDLFDTTESELVGSSYEDVLPEPVSDHIRRNDDSSDVLELDAGEAETYRITTSRINVGNDDSSIATAAVLESVPEFAEQRDQLQRRTAQLERQNEQLERFAGTVSHDLRNPLNVAQGYASRLDEDDVPYADKLRTAFDRMEEIIEDVLVLAREGQPIDETEPVSLDRIATHAWSSIHAPAASLSVGDAARLEADPERLRTLLENLFQNSVEHAGDDVSITVSTLPDEAGFFVADDGPGIPDDQKAAVLNHGFTTRPGGTGFGLSIVTQIAEAHGWDVTVADATTGGARFEFRAIE